MARHRITGKSVGRKRRRHTTHRRTHRRRRMGASGKLQPILMDGLAVGAGVVAIRELSILAGQQFTSLMASPIETGIGEIVIGGFAAWKAKSGFLRLMGLGAMGEGVMTVLNGAGVIGAPRAVSYQYVNRRMMGDPRLKFVAGAAQTTRIGAYPNTFGVVAGRKRRYSS